MKALIGQAANLPWYKLRTMTDVEIEKFNARYLVEIEMKDDSLSDVAFCNTKEGMHIRAKELGIKAYSLGCSCPDCNDGFARMLDSVGKKDGGYCVKCDTVWAAPGKCRCDPLLAKHEPALNVYAKQIWNDAIEAAAKEAGYGKITAYEIRKLKK